MPIYTLNTAEALIKQTIEKFKSRLQADIQLQLKNKKQVQQEASQLFASIVPNNVNFWIQYQALMKWSNTILPNDSKSIVVLKKWFLDHHKIVFATQIKTTNHKLQQQIQALCGSNKQQQIQQTIQIKKLQAKIEEQQAAIKHLTQQAQQLVSIQLPDNANPSQQQEAVKQLKHISAVIKLEPIIFINLSVQLHKSTVPQVIQSEKLTAVELLDKNIKRYQKMLDSENWFKKLVSWFSPERAKRNSALSDYHKNVTAYPLDNPEARFAAAEQWYFRHCKVSNSSRFYQHCLAPFETTLVQQQFERLFVNPENQAAQLKIHQDAIIGSKQAHQSKCDALEKEVYRLSEVQQKLQTKVRKFCITAQQAQPEILQLQKQQIELKNALGAPKSKLDSAKELALQIKTLSREMDLKDLQVLNLKGKVAELNADLGAMAVVHQSIEQLLHDMEEYSGKQNAAHSGGGVVEFVVAEIGSSEQQKQFKKLKSQADQMRADLNYHQQMLEANQFVNLLRHELQANILQLKLYQWWNAYQKHKRIDGKVPDTQSEEVYQQIRHYMTKAQKIHHAKNYVLEDWIQETLNYKHTNNLSPEEATMLVMMFGTEKQKEHWKTVEIPKINAEYALHQQKETHHFNYL